MDTTIIAKIRKEANFRKVLASDCAIFQLPENLEQSVAYRPETLLEEDEWFQLADFSKKSYCLDFLLQTFSSVNYDTIEKEDFGNIEFLCAHQDSQFHFQRVTKTRQLKKKIIFFNFGDKCRYEENSAFIVLKEYADAIYSPKNDILYFRELKDISAIFVGIDQLYREATEEEVKNFLCYPFIELAENFKSENVKTNNRKRIALAMETLKNFSEDEKTKVFDYIKDYCPELSNKAHQFHIHNEDSLKKLLYGIEQRYYTTPVGNERRLANSVILMPQGGSPQ